MPISAEARKLYPPNWRTLSKRIRERSGNKCEICAAPHMQLIARGGGSDGGTYMLEDGAVFDAETGRPMGYARGSEYIAARFIRVVITVGHRDHNPENNDETNLAAWCQMHHLRHDQGQHTENARKTRERKFYERTGQGRLFY